MLDTFLYAVNAILPILIIVALGYTVGQIGPWDAEFFKKLNQISFRVFVPVYLFYNIYALEDLSVLNIRVILFLVGSILGSMLVGMLFSKLFIHRHDQKAVVIQTAFRSNQGVLGLSLAAALGGDAAMAFATAGTAIAVPVFNLLAVMVLVAYSGNKEKKPTVGGMAKQVITNPLIIGVSIALVMVGIRSLLPVVNGQPIFTIKNQLPALYTAIGNIAKIGSPLMIFILGARLDLKGTKTNMVPLVVGVLLRLVICPALVLIAAFLLRTPLHLTSVELPTILSFCATPSAVNSAVMVQEIGGDDVLAGQLMVWTCVFSMFTMFCFVFVLRALGAL